MAAGSDNVFPKILTAVQASDPAAPSDGSWKLYSKAGGIYARSSNSIVGPLAAASVAASFVGAFVYNSTTQSFAATTLTTMAFNTEVYDTSAFHDNVTNNSRLVVPTTGKYRITGGIWYATTTGTNYILIDKNSGGVYIRGGATAWNGGSSGVHISTVTSLTAGDYVTMVGYHTEAGTTVTGDTGTTISQQNYFAIEYLGT